MTNAKKFYIDGKWVNPEVINNLDVLNPSNEKVLDTICLGTKKDLDKAVISARKAFKKFSKSSIEYRIDLLETIMNVYKKRMTDLARVMTFEMGAPIKFSSAAQAPSGYAHFKKAHDVLKNYKFQESNKTTLIVKEPIGVCGLITPWNWPMNQICCKVAPAIAAGCTMILKPSEVSPLNALIFAEILHEAEVPPGVFNLINGDGLGIGQEMSKHPGIDMISFTGSTRAGVSVASLSSESVKRVTQELGGKSANILLDDVDFEKCIKKAVLQCMSNSGQSCNAPTRLLIPSSQMDEAKEIAKKTIEKIVIGNSIDENTTLGPVVNETQYKKIIDLISSGIAEGATIITGGIEKPDGFAEGYFIKPTIFADVTNDMKIAKEEIFGPVLCILGYKNDQDAIEIANDSHYGLSGYVSSNDDERAKSVAHQLRTGNVHINYAPADISAPFGGYKMSGNGREWGEYGFEDYLEIKAIMGYYPYKKST